MNTAPAYYYDDLEIIECSGESEADIDQAIDAFTKDGWTVHIRDNTGNPGVVFSRHPTNPR